MLQEWEQDLFGSYVATVLATMVLGRETLSVDNYGGFANSVTNAYCRNWNCIFNYRTFFVKISDKTEDTTAKVQKH